MSLAAVLLALPALDPAALPALQERQEPAAAAAQPAPPAEDEAWKRRELELLTRIAQLETELAEAQARALRQQQEWEQYMRVLQGFEVVEIPEPPEFLAESLKTPVDPLKEAEARRAALRAARSAEIGRRLKALLIADGVGGLDFLDVGLLHEHNGRTCIGPVIGRLLDGRGRLVGRMRAEHLHLEVSRAARVVTLVLEEASQSSGGDTIRSEVDRIGLASIDPRPWIEAVPDLIDRADVDADIDDGTWDLPGLRVRLTQLLAASSGNGGNRWRIVGVGGVRQRRLMDVQFVELDARGAVQRRLFADSAEIRVPKNGLPEILLRDGSVKRGDRVAPFLDGSYSILLPFADAATWAAAEIPIVGR